MEAEHISEATLEGVVRDEDSTATVEAGHTELDKGMENTTTAEQLTDDELICALVEGSIGYYTPGSATLAVRDFREGRKECWSERCLACYGADLKKMVESDVRTWVRYTSEPRKERVRAMVRAWVKLPETDQMMVGLAFPTMM